MLMRKILFEDDSDIFSVSDAFESSMLLPIMKNLQDKAENGWDDYDEVYHCMQLIHAAEERENIRMSFHTFHRNEICLGILLISEGAIGGLPYFKDQLDEEMTSGAVVLNYFHICPEGRGVGSKWVKEILMPYLKEQRIRKILVKSSHPKAFSFYERLGRQIGKYTTMSDTGRFEREGRIYELPVR